jgi:signal transduction histidine kinase
MARRIVLTVVALIGALLITTVVPLGLLTTARERDTFRQDTALSARALAAVAEENLTDHRVTPTLASSLVHAARRGDQVWVFSAAGRLVAVTGGASAADLPVPPGIVAAVGRTGTAVTSEVSDRLWVVVGVRPGGLSTSAGVVVLSRSTGELDERLRVLWAWLIAVAAAGLMAAAIVAVTFARWVARPLSDLDAAAQRLGGGALDTRSAAGQGPPEVRRLAGTFNTMAGRLEALVHGHRATMADVSHQLRTPLAALRLRLDLLMQDADQATTAELADAQEEIARLSRLVDGLLAIARAENVVVEPVEVAVDSVIRDRASAWRPVAEERGVALTARCHGPVRASLGDGHLEQILDNVLANALDAVPSGGHVRVNGGLSGLGARITVADDGPGMSPQQREAAFRRFATSSPGGAGLGLAIVHRLVTSNGGDAALSDTPGGGLTVTIDLPAPQPDRAGARFRQQPSGIDSLRFLNDS